MSGCFFFVLLLCILILMIILKETNLLNDSGFYRRYVCLKEINKHVFNVYSHS
jgi:hypothetical protein